MFKNQALNNEYNAKKITTDLFWAFMIDYNRFFWNLLSSQFSHLDFVITCWESFIKWACLKSFYEENADISYTYFIHSIIPHADRIT